MSRTYRKIPEDEYWYITFDRVYDELKNNGINPLGTFSRYKPVPNKKEIALASRDGHGAFYAGAGTHEYYNCARRVTRQVERQQINKIYRLEDYEDIDFDDSRAIAKQKGVKWEIW